MNHERWMISIGVSLSICFAPALAQAKTELAAHGRVVDQEERPIAGAHVLVRPARDPESSQKVSETDLLTTTTGEDGRFELDRVPAPRLDLVARRQGFSTTVMRAVPVVREEGPGGKGPVDLGTLVLEPGAAIRGRVSDSHGRALAGVSVWLSRDLRRPARGLSKHRPETPPSAITDESGFFSVEDLRCGARFHLLLRGEGYLPATREAVTAPTGKPLDLRLEPSSRLRGRVVDEAHEAVAEAEVVLRPPELKLGQMEMPVLGDEYFRRVLTEDDGSFVVDEIPPGRFEITARAKGFVRSDPRPVRVGPEEAAAEVTLVLARGATLSGRLTVLSGEPVAGAQLRIEGGRGASDAEGVYRIAGIPPGSRVLEARHRIYRRLTREIVIEDGDNTLDLVFEPGREVSGRVVDDSGAAVGGAVVELRLADPEDPHLLRTVTGEAGGFSFPEVAEGTYRLAAEKRGHARSERAAALEVANRAVTGLELVLPVGKTIAGQIFGLDAGELASVTVEAERAGEPPRRGGVDYEGRYRITDLAAGDHLVRARIDGGSRQAEARVIVAPGVREVRRDLELGQGLTLAGHIVLGDEPLAGARVEVHGHDVAAKRRVLADHEGAFRVEDLAPGSYRVSVSHPHELVVRHEDVVLVGDREVLIEIGAARVFGHVTSAGGEPLESATVLMMQWLGADDEGSLYSTSTNEEGFFALPRMTAGRYRVTVRRAGYGTTEEMIDVGGGLDLGPLHFALAATRGLDLEVRRASGSPPPYVVAAVSRPDGRYFTADSRRVDAEGRTRLPTVPAGQWRVLVSAPGAAPVEIAAEVPGDPVALVLPDASRLRVRVPDLVETDRIATLSLLDAEGRRFQGLDPAGHPVGSWRVVGGTAEVEGVPSGLWTLRASTDDGRIWEAAIVTAAEPEVAVSLR